MVNLENKVEICAFERKYVIMSAINIEHKNSQQLINPHLLKHLHAKSFCIFFK